MAAKMRPCLALSVPVAEQDRALCTLVAHTTSPRGSQFEVAIDARFLKNGLFDVQNLITVPNAELMRRLGSVSGEHMVAVESVVRRWLGL